MPRNDKISNAVIKRLPRYRRYLNELHKNGVDKISSGELSEIIGYTASQIRQDLNNFGGFGQQGYGYNVKELYDEISAILGLDKAYRMVIVGAGNLGYALVNYTHYYKSGFIVDAIFDNDPNEIGNTLNGIKIYDANELVDFVKEHNTDIGIICTPKDVAQEIADKLSFAGVKGIWNFAPIDIEVPPHVAMQEVHLSDSLYSLAYHMNSMQNKK